MVTTTVWIALSPRASAPHSYMCYNPSFSHSPLSRESLVANTCYIVKALVPTSRRPVHFPDTQGGNYEPVQALCIALVRGPSIREGVLLSPLITATQENKCIALVGQQFVGMYGLRLTYTANSKQSPKIILHR